MGVAAEDKDPRSRKSSEPPPSLQGLFDHDMGSSRRWMNKQLSADHVTHPKQHSLDNTHLRATTPQSPKLHTRRVKSPSTSDKNNRVELTEGVLSGRIQRTPSHPHLNSPLGTPLVTKSLSNDSPMIRAHSTQQLQDIGNEEYSSNSSRNRYDSLQVESGLKNNKGREIYQSKESLKDSSLLKMHPLAVSHESLVSTESVTVKETSKDIVVEHIVPVTVQEVQEESSSDQSPLQTRQQPKQPVDLKRRNSSLFQYGLAARRGSDGTEHSGKKRPRYCTYVAIYVCVCTNCILSSMSMYIIIYSTHDNYYTYSHV